MIVTAILPSLFFFFQAEDGIRDLYVTGVQTCALPICPFTAEASATAGSGRRCFRREWAQARDRRSCSGRLDEISPGKDRKSVVRERVEMPAEDVALRKTLQKCNGTQRSLESCYSAS